MTETLKIRAAFRSKMIYIFGNIQFTIRVHKGSKIIQQNGIDKLLRTLRRASPPNTKIKLKKPYLVIAPRPPGKKRGGGRANKNRIIYTKFYYNIRKIELYNRKFQNEEELLSFRARLTRTSEIKVKTYFHRKGVGHKILYYPPRFTRTIKWEDYKRKKWYKGNWWKSRPFGNLIIPLITDWW